MNEQRVGCRKKCVTLISHNVSYGAWLYFECMPGTWKSEQELILCIIPDTDNTLPVSPWMQQFLKPDLTHTLGATVPESSLNFLS